MKLVIILLMLVTVATGLTALAGLVGEDGMRVVSLTPTACGISLVTGVLFLVLAARQSRKDREAREERLWRENNHQ